ncbi:uncharacterized protein LOC119985526 [Tripterygium wilfordii]|uniref:uncharacterized protein LOC119985526 n=1 Tax=Tripterygium wilfordii TaxID=458696 RepID=UPI0018F83C45|nr:uncharacterized protein LOC119985526 [Tripterygium wilfordii]
MLRDGKLYKKGPENDLLLRCLSQIENEVAHQKPWPIKGWAMDLIGKIFPSSNEGRHFVIVATVYLTQWAQALPLKFVTQQDMIKVIKDSIIHRFSLPQHIMADRGTIFVGEGNGQAESTNKVLRNIIDRMVENRPRAWHKALWAYRTSKRTATRATPFMMTYGQDAVLPMEMEIRSTRKQKVMKAYNRIVREKTVVVADLVWKVILPIGQRDSTYDKWSPFWEGPYQVTEVKK